MWYNPDVDISPVNPLGFVDVRKAYASGIVSGDVSIEQSSFNGVDDPGSLMHRSQDVFEAYRKADYVKKSLAASKSETEKASSDGTN